MEIKRATEMPAHNKPDIHFSVKKYEQKKCNFTSIRLFDRFNHLVDAMPTF